MEEIVEKNLGKEGKKSPQIRLKEREFQILGALGKWGILGLGQLEGLLFKQAETQERIRLFFDEYDRISFDHYGYKRLRRLEKAGYIGKEDTAYSLKRRGYAALVETKRPAGILRRSWSPRAVWHHLRINAVGLVLEKIVGFPIASRHELLGLNRITGLPESHINQRIPDLLVRERLPILFTSEFSSRRYWQGQKERPSRAPVLYLLPVPSYKDWAMVLLRQEKMDNAYLGDLEEFRQSLDKTVFTNIDGLAVTLREAAERPF